MGDVSGVPIKDQLRKALASARQPTDVDHLDERDLSAFEVRLEMQCHLARGEVKVIGRAMQTFLGVDIPRTGEYLVGIGPWGERPITGLVRVVRVENRPIARSAVSTDSPKTTVVSICTLESTVDPVVVEHGLRRDGWTTDFF